MAIRDLFKSKHTKQLEKTVQMQSASIRALTKSYPNVYHGPAGCGFDLSSFLSYINGGYMSVSASNAYDLFDTAAPLANAVDKIAGAISGLTPVVRTDDNELVTKSNALDVLRNPGFGQTYQQFIEDFAVAYLLTRNAYAITDPFKRTIRTPKPFCVDPQANESDGYAGSYRVTSLNGSGIFEFNREIKSGEWLFKDALGQELFHIKGQTDNDGLLGRSPIEAILVEISQNIEGGKHNLSLLQNGLRLSGMMSTEQELSDDQYTRLKEQVDSQLQGSDNAGQYMLGENGLKFVEMSTTNKDMDYATVLKYSKEEISNKYNIPLPLISSDGQTFNNYSTAVQALYDDAVFPIAEILFNGIGKALGIDEGLKLTFDKDEVPAIRERRINEAATRHKIGVFTPNETRDTMGVEPFPGGDTVYQAANLLPIGEDDGAQDGGEIVSDEEKGFMNVLQKQYGMTKEEAREEWLKLQS